jgi:hypothetical protein
MVRALLLLSGAVAALALSACSPSLDKQVLGKWKYSVTLDVNLDDKEASGPGQMKLDCSYELFENKSSTADCKYQFGGETKGEDGAPVKLLVEGSLKATGEWSVSDKIILDKVVDSKATVDVFTVNNARIDDAAVLENLRGEMNSTFVKGETSKLKTLAIEKDKWSFEQEVDGKPVAVTATRL